VDRQERHAGNGEKTKRKNKIPASMRIHGNARRRDEGEAAPGKKKANIASRKAMKEKAYTGKGHPRGRSELLVLNKGKKKRDPMAIPESEGRLN